MEFVFDDGILYLGDRKEPDAYISFSQKDGEIVVKHTVVSQKLQGQGIAEKLTRELIKKAREENFKINPICSYTVRFFEKNKEETDILAY